MSEYDISRDVSETGEIEKCMDIADLIDGLPDATGADVSADLALADAMVAA
jgi:hypothetical protein